MNFEKHSDNIIETEKGLSTGEITPKDRLQNQIRLATAVYTRLNGFIDMDSKENRNKIMDFWSEGENSFSKIYRDDIENSDEFKFNPRLGGDIYKITPEDVIYFKENVKLPE